MVRRVVSLTFLAWALALPVGPAHAAATPLPPDFPVVFEGHGWGHGRGLGQWGARGLAESGKSWTGILSSYYSEAVSATRSPEWIRILVEQSLTVLVTSDAAFSVNFAGGPTLATSDSTFKFIRARLNGTQVVVEKAPDVGGPWTSVGAGTAPLRFSPTSSLLQLVFDSGAVRIYRGFIEARLPSGATSLLGINENTVEGYLYGSVPREMPASWPAEALKAQAVSARSYATNKKDSARAAGKLYDICATTSCQVYGGYASKPSVGGAVTKLESPAANAAVDATKGVVLTYGGKPILAEYSSSTGGYTAAGTVPYLAPVPDPGDAVSPHHLWRATVTASEIETAWPQIGRLVNIRVTQRNGYGDWGGRVLQAVVEGTAGEVTVSGSTIRARWEWPARSNGLRSTWFNPVIFNAALVSATVDPSGPAGGDIPVAVSLRNTGNVAWAIGGDLRLGAADPEGRSSPFAGGDWISPSLPSAVTRNATRPGAGAVSPGEVGEFRFTLHTATVQPGTYTEAFRPVVGTSTWLPDVGLSLEVRVLPSWTEDIGDLLSNSSFESGPVAWTGDATGAADGIVSSPVRAGRRALHLAGGGWKSVHQTVGYSGETGSRLTVAGWSKTVGSSAAGGPVALLAGLSYADGTTGWGSAHFARGQHDWTYAERTIAAAKPFVAVTLYAAFRNQTGHAYFDAIRVLDTGLANPSFELGAGSWTASGLTAADGPSSAQARDGMRSFRFAAGSAARGLVQHVPEAGPAGRRLVLAAWTKAAGGEGAPASLSVTFNNADGTTTRTAVEDAAGPHDWSYLEGAFVAAKAYRSVDVGVSASNTSGDLSVDGVRLVTTFTANPSFEGQAAPWTPYPTLAEGNGLTTTVARDAAGALGLSGGAGRRGMTQHVALSGSRGTRLSLGGWSRAAGTNAAGGALALSVALRNSDGTASWFVLQLPRGPHDWAWREVAFTAPKWFRSLDVYAIADDQTGHAYFDGVTLRAA
jgi:SpoIID/LytB domain protein